MRIFCSYGILLLLICCSSNEKKCTPPTIHKHVPINYLKGYEVYTNLDSARKCAEITGRKILILFTYYHAASVPFEFWKFLDNDRIRSTIADNYIFTVLMLDDRTNMNPPFKKSYSGQPITTIGKMNGNIQASLFKSNALPEFILTDLDFEENSKFHVGTRSGFLKFLRSQVN